MVFVNVLKKYWFFLEKLNNLKKKNVVNISKFLICMHGNQE